MQGPMPHRLLLPLLAAALLLPAGAAQAHHRPAVPWWALEQDEVVLPETDAGLDPWAEEDEEAPPPPVPAFPAPGDTGPDAGQDGEGWAPAGPPRPQPPALPPLVTGKLVPGKVARMRTDGRAAIPRGAPRAVRRLIAAYNQIIGRPYKWGGGHGRLVDRGYDCSGTVSYGLIRTGVLHASMVSGSFARWGSAGAGRWVTIYANKGHVYLEVAGLRLDTSAVGDAYRGGKGVRWRSVIGRRPGFSVRHPTGF
jgi:hypothetical protein